MNIEEKLRGAFDAPAPPPTATLEAVLKRGRRRVFAHRAGAVLGVVAVVAGIGIGATTLNVATPPTPADAPNDLPTAAQDWPRVDTPARTPQHTWAPGSTAPPPAGRQVLRIPVCPLTWPKQEVHPGADQLPAGFADELARLLPRELPDKTITTWPTGRGLQFDVTDGGGTGSVEFAAARFTGSPLDFANDSLWETGDCAPARRLVLPDGSVVQLHETRGLEPFQSLVQRMSVFRADGLLVRVELCNYGSPDVTPDPHTPGTVMRTGAGRADLPLTEEQFMRLGPAIAGVA